MRTGRSLTMVGLMMVRLMMVGLMVVVVVSGCGLTGTGSNATSSPTGGAVWVSAGAAHGAPSAVPSSTASAKPKPSSTPTESPLHAGNPNGHAAVPAAARAVDTSHPTRVIGHGTPASCTSAAVIAAVAAGGIITFSCGPDPMTITMTATAKVRNAHTTLVLDGGGLVTLDGGGKHRILYMNTCDKAQGWTTSHCQDQETPQLTVQNITFADGNATGETIDGGGGGAIFDRGGRIKVINSRFIRNRCDATGPDLGGAAIRVLSQSHGLPVYIVHSTFGGAPGLGGVCSNGGALSSIGVSWVVLNSVMTYNSAIGNGANPAQHGTPGGGSGGAIYNDGNLYTLTVAGTIIENNHANEGGGAIFFVSNDRTGTMTIDHSTLLHNRSDKFQNFPGIFFLGAKDPTVISSTIK